MDRKKMLNEIYNKISTNDYDPPISLSRLLSELWEWYTYYVTLEKIYDWDFWYIPRRLLTKSGSDAYLENQSDDTIKAIHDLLLDK
jgi:hypothetical protein